MNRRAAVATVRRVASYYLDSILTLARCQSYFGQGMFPETIVL